jgi:hypothetical protein
MTMEQDAQEMDTSFTIKARERILVWINIVASAPVSLSTRLRRLAAGIGKSTWLVFAIVLAANIIAFNYYQARITRYYISVLLTNIVRLNDDIDTLQTKIDQLNKKTDDTSSNLAKHRGK